MFRAIGRLFRTLGYLLTGRIDKISDIWASKPGVIGATYDHIVNEKRSRLNVYKDAVGGMIAQEVAKQEKLKALTAEIEKLEKLKAGALAKAQQVAKILGNDPEKVKANPDYIKCQAAFRDFSTTLDEKNKRITELEADIKALSTNIAGHKVQIDGLLRDMEKIKGEKNEAIADIVSAQEEQKIADMFNGLSEDNTSKDLERLREVRTKAKANAKMSRELAGMDATKSENEFLEYATATQADTEFDKLIGLTKEEAAPTTSEPTKINES